MCDEQKDAEEMNGAVGKERFLRNSKWKHKQEKRVSKKIIESIIWVVGILAVVVFAAWFFDIIDGSQKAFETIELLAAFSIFGALVKIWGSKQQRWRLGEKIDHENHSSATDEKPKDEQKQ